MDFWRIAFLVVLIVGCLLQALILFIIWKPLTEMRSSANKLEEATEKLKGCNDLLDAAKKYDKLAEMQLEQAKHAMARVPAQIEQGVQKAIVATALANQPSSGIGIGQS